MNSDMRKIKPRCETSDLTFVAFLRVSGLILVKVSAVNNQAEERLEEFEEQSGERGE